MSKLKSYDKLDEVLSSPVKFSVEECTQEKHFPKHRSNALYQKKNSAATGMNYNRYTILDGQCLFEIKQPFRLKP